MNMDRHDAEALDRYLTTDPANQPDDYPCYECGEIFPTFESLESHNCPPKPEPAYTGPRASSEEWELDLLAPMQSSCRVCTLSEDHPIHDPANIGHNFQ